MSEETTADDAAADNPDETVEPDTVRAADDTVVLPVVEATADDGSDESDDRELVGVGASSGPRRPGRGARYVGWIPFICVLAAIALVATAGITWVTSPNWHKEHVTTAKARNVGQVPTKPGTTVSYTLSPNRIEIPRLHEQAPIVQVNTTADRQLEIPLDPKIVGWWAGGAMPGAKKGTAILAGHINYAGVDGALARINLLNPGDLVYIYGKHLGKATKVKFKITGVRTYYKKTLPYAEIFDQSSVGRVAIVTCGGPFDASTGNYLDNIVAFAVPA
jgi:Sortase domain